MDDMGLGEYFLELFPGIFSTQIQTLLATLEEEMNHLLFMGALMLGLLVSTKGTKKKPTNTKVLNLHS